MYLQTDLKAFDFSGLGTKFDVILLEPPLEEYQRRASGVTFSWSPWDWEEVGRGGGEKGEGRRRRDACAHGTRWGKGREGGRGEEGGWMDCLALLGNVQAGVVCVHVHVSKDVCPYLYILVHTCMVHV